VCIYGLLNFLQWDFKVVDLKFFVLFLSLLIILYMYPYIMYIHVAIIYNVLKFICTQSLRKILINWLCPLKSFWFFTEKHTFTSLWIQNFQEFGALCSNFIKVVNLEKRNTKAGNDHKDKGSDQAEFCLPEKRSWNLFSVVMELPRWLCESWVLNLQEFCVLF
jgi:hypothetical protein